MKRTLEYYASILFKQYFNEGVAQWGARIDAVAIELRREVRNRLEKIERREGEDAHYVEGGLRLIGEFMKGTFIVGLKDERIKYIVKAKGEDESLAQLVETAPQEESEVKSQKFRAPQTSNWPQGYVKKEIKTERPLQIKREVNLATGVQCFKCNEQGHIARHCRKLLTCSKCKQRGHDVRNCKQGNRQ